MTVGAILSCAVLLASGPGPGGRPVAAGRGPAAAAEGRRRGPTGPPPRADGEPEWERGIRREIERIPEAGGDPFY